MNVGQTFQLAGSSFLESISISVQYTDTTFEARLNPFCLELKMSCLASNHTLSFAPVLHTDWACDAR